MNGHSENTRRSADLQSEIEKLGPWFHNLHLPDGSQTRSDHPLGDFPLFKWKQIETHLPGDLRDWRALDIGCNAGFYSFKLAERGASVTGIDLDPHYLRQAEWAVEQYGLKDRVHFKQMQIYDLVHQPETYDLVLFMGVFYHLRYPLLGLDIVSRILRRLMIFQTMTVPGEEVYEDTFDRDIMDREALLEPGWPKMAFLEHRLANDPTNWWVPNHAGVEAMLRSAGLRVISRPGHEIYLCEPDTNRNSETSIQIKEELLSATGSSFTKTSGNSEEAQ